MRYIKILAALAVVACLLVACDQKTPPNDYTKPQTQTGTEYQSSWITGISKESASQNTAVADWLTLCADSARDDIGHYVLRNVQDNGDGTSTHHLLLYRSATEYDAASFTVTFTMDKDLLTVTPTYTSSDKALYGYDLIYLTFCTDSDIKTSVEMLVDNDYPGHITTTVDSVITPDTFGNQSDE